MNLEKKEYIPEEYRDIYEDEIDLKELFLVLWRNKIKIAAAAFICMVLRIWCRKSKRSKKEKIDCCG